jgi:hypothetical protein
MTHFTLTFCLKNVIMFFLGGSIGLHTSEAGALQLEPLLLSLQKKWGVHCKVIMFIMVFLEDYISD